VADGVWVPAGAGARFLPMPELLDEDVLEVAEDLAARVADLLRRRGLGDDEPRDDDALAPLQAASLLGRIALGEHAGGKVERAGDDPDPLARLPRPLCALVGGWSVHAATLVPEGDRLALERLLRYGLRGPLALSRLFDGGGGRVGYELRHPLGDGTTTLFFEPLELLAKLAALVPYAREHMVHYLGVFAPHAALRANVVPSPPPAHRLPGWRRRRLDWADLLRRVWAVEVMICALCGGQRRIIATIHEGPVARRILRHLGLDEFAPPRARARAPPQGDLGFDPPPPDDFDQSDRSCCA
jgi:hypothetical protein